MSTHPPSKKLSNRLGSDYERGSLGEFEKKAGVCDVEASSIVAKVSNFLDGWLDGLQ